MQICVAGGRLVIDHIAVVDFIPELDAVSPQADFHEQIVQEYLGGCSCNIAAAAAKLGALVTYAGIGGTEDGERRWTDALGLLFQGPPPFLPSPGRICHCYQIYDRTQKKLSFMDVPEGDEDRDLYHGYEGCMPLICLAPPSGDAHVDSLRDLMVRTLENGHWTAVSMVSSAQTPDFDILGLAQYLFLNHYEAQLLEQLAGPNYLDGLLTQRALVIFETLGADGVIVRARGQAPVHVAALQVAQVEDATGAGDSFAGSVMTALDMGYGPITAARIGCVAAACVLEQRGAQTGQPYWPEAKRRYEMEYGRLEEPEQ